VSDKGDVTMDWGKAKRHLQTAERAYHEIGFSGAFALAFVIKPCLIRFERGERTQELYDEIMEIAL